MSTTVKPDYWSLLGIEPDSDFKQIKRAFRREARKWHPDLNNNDINAEERFKLINEAYAILSDPRRRKEWQNLQNNCKQVDDPFYNRFPSYEEYIDIILDIKNNSSSNDKIEEEYLNLDDDTDVDINVDLDLDVDEDINYENNDIKDEESLNNNLKRRKSNENTSPVQALKDIETIVDITPDEALYGSSVDISLEDGTIVEISTPPFAGDGWRLKISGSLIGIRDHFIQLRVRTEEGLRIDGLRVLYRLELFPADALLGCAVEVPTLSGMVTLQVPPESSSGRLLRLRGRGLEFNEMKGDQIVEIVIVFPLDTTDSEIALYKRLQELSNENS
tara:strand:- start:160 stop:1155 length:996 start_codon:yes stop_codon:yes gene_type:complete